MSTPRAYQRVNTATDYDYDFSKFPPFLRFDGVDDSMYTAASVDFTTTDKMTVFAGVHKASDATGVVLLETSADVTSTNGTFAVFAPLGAAANISSYVRGSAVSAATYVNSAVAAPATKVLSTILGISADTNVLRLNGVQAISGASDQGTGNFGNHVLNVGRRNNASLPFSGRIYQLAIKGKSLSAGEIATVESFINSRTKAF